jgi:hypothetical protein
MQNESSNGVYYICIIYFFFFVGDGFFYWVNILRYKRCCYRWACHQCFIEARIQGCVGCFCAGFFYFTHAWSKEEDSRGALIEEIRGAVLQMDHPRSGLLHGGCPYSCGLGCGYTDHVLEQIASRDGGIGVSQGALLDAWANPVKINYVPSKWGPTFLLTGNDAVIVVNADGKVVTGWAKSAAGTGQ